MAGKLIPIISEIRATTTSISIRVTPEVLARLVLPADNVGIDSISAGLAIGAIADDVGLVSMLTGKAINIGMAPRIVFNLFLQIRSLPVLHRFRPLAKGLQALIRCREDAGVQFV